MPPPDPSDRHSEVKMARQASLVHGRGSGQRRTHNPPASGQFNVQAKSGEPPAYSFVDLPNPNGTAPFHKDLDQIVSVADYNAITRAGSLTFHVVGDTGDHRGGQKDFVANMMTNDANAMGPQEPAFCYHLGDLVYFAGDADLYSENFYETYKDYPSFIVAITGNHDCYPIDVQGDRTSQGSDHLESGKGAWDGFITNFMADDPSVQGSPTTGAERTVMDLPNVYWTLNTPFATFIGLCSNVGESEAVIKQDQIDWFEDEVKNAPADRPLIVAIHHPPYSGDMEHSGSSKAEEVLFGAFEKYDIYPTLILSGHVHNYQRFTKRVTNAAGVELSIPCVVSGNGGYTKLGELQKVGGAKPPRPFEVQAGLELSAYDDKHFGFVRFKVEGDIVTGTYIGETYVAGENITGTVYETFDINWRNHTVATTASNWPAGL